MEQNDFAAFYTSLSSPKLLSILSNREKYQPEAIAAAEAELTARGIDFENPSPEEFPPLPERKPHTLYPYVEDIRDFVLHPLTKKPAASLHRMLFLFILAETVYRLPGFIKDFEQLFYFLRAPLPTTMDGGFFFSAIYGIFYLAYYIVLLIQVVRFLKYKRFAWMMLAGENYYRLLNGAWGLVLVGYNMLVNKRHLPLQHFMVSLLIALLWLAFHLLKTRWFNNSELKAQHRIRPVHNLVVALIAAYFSISLLVTWVRFWL